MILNGCGLGTRFFIFLTFTDVTRYPLVAKFPDLEQGVDCLFTIVATVTLALTWLVFPLCFICSKSSVQVPKEISRH
jgi:bacteriorhodopsin